MSVLQLGFRPFYSAAAIFAIAAVIIWLAAFLGLLQTGPYLHGIIWHSHEMLFGFAVAVIAGFLLTAVRNWTGLATPTGASLGLLVMLWILARIFILFAPAAVAAAVDVLFLPMLAMAIAIPILRSSNKRNYKVLVIVLALAVAHGVFHLASLRFIDPELSRKSLFVSIDIVVILMSVIGGRVIPVFTRNAVAHAKSRHQPWVEVTTFGSMILLSVAIAISGQWVVPPVLVSIVSIVAAASHATRLALWDPVATIHKPLLWMMPAAYSWIAFAFVLRALAAASIVPAGAWIHAVTMGAVSGLMLAMMMRSSLGHTGRQLVASKADVAAFVLLQFAAIVRVFASIVGAQGYRYWIVASGLLWVAALTVFALRYLPMLGKARVSG